MALVAFDDEKAGVILLNIISRCTTYDDLIKGLEDELISFMNLSFAIIVGESKTKICTVVGDNIVSYDLSSFHKVIRPINKINLKMVGNYQHCDYEYVKKLLSNFKLSGFWFNSNKRRQIHNIVFKPPPLKFDDKNEINLFKGFNITREEAEKGYEYHEAVKEFKLHIQRMSGKDKDLFNWIVSWFAQMIQRPADIQGTALIIKSVEGCGKGVLYEALKNIIGDDYCVHACGADMILGRFNSSIERAIFIFADELMYAGDHEKANVFKKVISEKTLSLEKKGVDAHKIINTSHFMASSNDDWIINCKDQTSRRFTVVEMDNTFNIKPQIEKDYICDLFKTGAVHIAKYLYNFKCVSVREKFDTTNLLQQILYSLTGVKKFIVDLVEAEDEANGVLFWNTEYTANEIFQKYMKSYPTSRINAQVFGKEFHKYTNIESYQKKKDGVNSKFYMLPPKIDFIKELRKTIHKNIFDEYFEDEDVVVEEDEKEDNVEDNDDVEEDLKQFKHILTPPPEFVCPKGKTIVSSFIVQGDEVPDIIFK